MRKCPDIRSEVTAYRPPILRGTSPPCAEGVDFRRARGTAGGTPEGPLQGLVSLESSQLLKSVLRDATSEWAHCKDQTHPPQRALIVPWRLGEEIVGPGAARTR